MDESTVVEATQTQPSESLIRETPGRAGRSPDNDGTHRHYRTARVRQARREGGREEPAW